MKIERKFSSADSPVEHQIRWKVVPAQIDRKTGLIGEVEVPETWSQNAANILADLYLRKAGIPAETYLNTDSSAGIPLWLIPRRPVEGTTFGAETSARQAFHRLAGAWTYHGWRAGHLTTDEDAHAFFDECYMMLALQIMAPNSPQWFNTGLWWAYGITGGDTGMWRVDPDDHRVTDDGWPIAARVPNSYEYPQPHACFLTPTTDDLVNEGGIMDTWGREARIFKHGSGSGVNPSVWRGKNEPLSGGGVASGLMGWLRIGDSAAGAISSGGTTRRAAKMVCLDDDHPELIEFIDWKLREEGKAAAMDVGSQLLRNHQRGARYEGIDIPRAMLDRLENGFEPEPLSATWESEAMRTIDGQNSNNSIRVTDRFILAIDGDEPWNLTARTTGETVKSVPAKELWSKICRAAWACADPGLIFHDTVNAWNTCAADGVIRTTNPCFTGDTKVWTIDGPRRFDELAVTGASVPVLTELSDGQLAYRMMENPRMTRRSAKLVKVTLRAYRHSKRAMSVTELRVTPEHEFFMRDGSRKRAIDLKPKDSIESAYRRRANQKGYISIRATNGDHAMEHNIVAEYDHGRRPVWPAEHGHHVDEVKDRNVSGNVKIVSASFHNSEHMRGDRNPMRRWFDLLSPDEQAAHRAKYSRPGSSNPNYGNNKISGRLWINDGDRCRRISPETPIPEGWQIGYLRRNNYQSEETRAKRATAVKASWERRRSANHIVVNVEELTESADVYCGTVPSTGRFFVSLGEEHYEGVLVSNCAEFHHLDGSACNLASLRLTAFLRKDGEFDVAAYKHAARLTTIVLDISVTMASFPAREFAEGAYNYRTLGLGYMDLGGLLMQMALPYDSDAGRALAASLTAIMTGVAYLTSAEMAREEQLGPFPRYGANRDPMDIVMHKHRDATKVVPMPAKLGARAQEIWGAVCLQGSISGFRNAQTTLIAPTGTISFVADCDTSGIEPDYALVKHKQLAGGGAMKIVNRAIPTTLRRLGYDEASIRDVVSGIENGQPIDEFGLLERDRRIFDCVSELEPMAHVKMLAAIQPFLSGAASKTVNLPNDATVEDVSRVYREAHRLGVKAIALYRDGSKLTQPLAATKPKKKVVPTEQPERFHKTAPPVTGAIARGQREPLPSRRKGETQKARVGGQTVYWRTGEYPDGRLGEVFIDLAGAGSTLDGFANCLAKIASIALQFGAPVSEVVDALLGIRFEPAGHVELHDRIKWCTSIVDLAARDLAITYDGREDLANVVRAVAISSDAVVALDKRAVAIAEAGGRTTGETCDRCGGPLVQTGTCKTCADCGVSVGGCG